MIRLTPDVLCGHRMTQGQTPPPTPTNEDRIRKFRQSAPVVLANGKRWKWHRKH